MPELLQNSDRSEAGAVDLSAGEKLVSELWTDSALHKMASNQSRDNDSSNNLPKIEFTNDGDSQQNLCTADSPEDDTEAGHLKPGDTKTGAPSVAEKLISELGSADYPTREKATADLKKLGAEAMPDVLKATNDDDPEIAARAKRLVKEIVGESMHRKLADISFDLQLLDLSGPDAQQRAKEVRTEFEKYNNDPEAKQKRIQDLEQMQKQIGEQLKPKQRDAIADQLRDLNDMGTVKRRLDDISQFADLRTEEEEMKRQSEFFEQLPPPFIPPMNIGIEDLREGIEQPVQVEGHGEVFKNVNK
ncbi:MAG: hypothetical protein SGJ27_06510 [Candidatus Melainabacteria bacterium]|nr:hypothetical protein [Candidatus Melainabacteria bacterium]